MRKGESLLNIAVVILTACAIVITALVVRREFYPASRADSRPREVAGWRSFAREGQRMGPVAAPVTVVVFSDFQCPFCAMLMKRLRTLRDKYPREIAVVYRHFPLPIHSYAVAAVRASECAAAQGRFEQFHDALFAAQDSIGVVPWDRFAVTAGIANLPAFQVCNNRTDPIPALARDTLAGKRLDVTATPTFLINETRLQGAQPLDTLEAYVQRALKSARAGAGFGSADVALATAR